MFYCNSKNVYNALDVFYGLKLGYLGQSVKWPKIILGFFNTFLHNFSIC